MESCPITGEPLLNPGQTISQSAANRIKTQTRGLAALMNSIPEHLAEKRGSEEGRRGSRPTSTPPLNVHLLDLLDAHRDTVMIWAASLAAHVNPTLRFRNGDWQQVEAIYQQYADRALNWQHAPTMIDEVLDALHQIEHALTPQTTPQLSEPEKEYAAGALLNRWLTITPACQAVQLLTGVQLSASTVRKWKQRGKIQTQGDPPRYKISDLIDCHTHP